MQKIPVSIVIPCRNEENYIGNCIASLLKNENSDYDCEIIVVDGNSSDKTLDIIKCWQSKTTKVKLVENRQQFTPMGLNLGVKNASNDYVLIASAHSTFSDDYISVLLSERERLNADIVGGIMITDVQNHTSKAEAIKEVLACKFGVGNAMFRIGVTEPMQVDTVPFGLYKRKIFDEVGYYDERLIRNHDIELSKRFLAAGKRIFLVPSATCTYYARETFKAISQNNYRNGLWNILTVKITGKFSSLSIRHFVPMLFLLSLIIPSLCSFFYFPLILISAASLLFYLTFISCISINLSIKKNLNFFYLISTFIVLHISYGFGSLVGIFKNPK